MDVCPAENTHLRMFLLIGITFKHDLGVLGTISINFQNSRWPPKKMAAKIVLFFLLGNSKYAKKKIQDGHQKNVTSQTVGS